MNETNWFYSEGQETYGPFSSEQIVSLIQSGLLKAEHHLVPEGSEDWQLVSASVFSGFLAPAQSRPATPRVQRPGAPAVRMPQARLAPPAHSRAQLPRRKSSAPMWAGVVLLLAGGGLALWWMQAKTSAASAAERAETAPSLPDPIARFTFDGITPEPDADLQDAAQHDGILELDGSYEHGNGVKKTRAVLKTPSLDYHAFTIVVRLRPDDIDRAHCTLVMGGTSFRWLGLEASPEGDLSLTMNNHSFMQPVPGVKIAANRWVTLAISLDLESKQAAVYADARRAAVIPLPPDFQFNVFSDSATEQRDKVWTFADYSNARTFKGAVDEFQLYGSVLTSEQIARIKIGSASAPTTPVASAASATVPARSLPSNSANTLATAKLDFLASNAMAKMGGYRPQKAATSSSRPASITKAPDGLTVPEYGEIKMGPASSQRTHAFVLDNPDSLSPRLFVDTNANGDLTDDAPAIWKRKTFKKQDGTESVSTAGDFQLELKLGGESLLAHINAYRFDPKDAKRPHDMLLYYCDYARTGHVALGGKNLEALLCDDECKGDFSTPASTLRLDVNGDGRFDWRSETFRVAEPFNVGGTTYEIAGLTSSGSSFQIIKSSRTVAEVKPAPVISAGKPAPAFEAVTLSGENVKLDGSFKGKVVLLDFWATWCGPCVGELPNVIAAYEKHHGEGFEILGISLDSADAKDKLAAFLKDKKMTWRQVCDGHGWKAAIAQMYGIDSIPATFLIDGDTGIVLAVGARGAALEPAIAKALAEKKR